MKNIKWHREWPFLFIFSLPWIVYFSLRDTLPAEIPSHFSVTDHGWVTDSVMPPLAFLITMSIVMGVLYLILLWTTLVQWIYYFKLMILLFFSLLACYVLLSAGHLVPDMKDPKVLNTTMLVLSGIVNLFVFVVFNTMRKQDKMPVSRKYYNIIWVGTHVITSLGPLIVIMGAEGFRSERLLPQAVFLFFAIMGNLTYNIKPNRFIGIRTPWTLMNEEVWRKTHHEGGKWLFGGGLAGLVISIFVPVSWLHPLLLIILCSVTGYLILYSYLIYRKIAG